MRLLALACVAALLGGCETLQSLDGAPPSAPAAAPTEVTAPTFPGRLEQLVAPVMLRLVPSAEKPVTLVQHVEASGPSGGVRLTIVSRGSTEIERQGSNLLASVAIDQVEVELNGQQRSQPARETFEARMDGTGAVSRMTVNGTAVPVASVSTPPGLLPLGPQARPADGVRTGDIINFGAFSSGGAATLTGTMSGRVLGGTMIDGQRALVLDITMPIRVDLGQGAADVTQRGYAVLSTATGSVVLLDAMGTGPMRSGAATGTIGMRTILRVGGTQAAAALP